MWGHARNKVGTVIMITLKYRTNEAVWEDWDHVVA